MDVQAENLDLTHFKALLRVEATLHEGVMHEGVRNEWHVLKVLSHKELVILRERAPKLVLVDDRRIYITGDPSVA